ncbi:hypothetical protein HFN60_27210 [Rhizobium leguminosarum]|uniref:hypothetical protein n=1 Tax=Rhizobium leguminosarum TaxID=384 RepID=UPI001C97FF3E|nr:hypothetical protein [Rhizobium leguminosarum]MBY5819286.1 hypothetical protein [Rhizobium leguminosarum]
MPDWKGIFSGFTSWEGWAHFKLEYPAAVTPSNIFGLAEYLAALAMFLVILTTSDYRYRYRLSLTRINLQRVGFWATALIGASLLVVDIWFANGLPVPKLLSNQADLKAALGAAFMALLLRVFHVALISPPVFSSWNAERFFSVHYSLIHEGNAEKLIIVAEELRRSAGRIVNSASKIGNTPDKKVSVDSKFAYHFLLLIGDRRFCRLVVDKVPSLSLVLFDEFQKHPRADLPVFQFARNIGQQFILNLSSSYYQEDSGYYSGLLGYDQPVTRAVFGNYRFIERCAERGASPLEVDLQGELSGEQTEGACRAGLAYLKGYLETTKGRRHSHSYALHRLLAALGHTAGGVHVLDGKTDYYEHPSYHRLKAVTNFVRKAISLIDEHADPPESIKPHEHWHDVYDGIADLVFEVVMAASSVKSPDWTAWAIQHNTVWGQIFGFSDGRASRIIGKKVSRLLYNEIREMDEWPNFKGARALGFCLLVLGLSPIERRRGYRKEDSPLQALAARWASKNYARLLNDHPEVAAACLMGSVTYDNVGQRFVKTFADHTRKEPQKEYLKVAQPRRKSPKAARRARPQQSE